MFKSLSYASCYQHSPSLGPSEAADVLDVGLVAVRCAGALPVKCNAMAIWCGRILELKEGIGRNATFDFRQVLIS